MAGWVGLLLVLTMWVGCSHRRGADHDGALVSPLQAMTRGDAPKARHMLLSTRPDGSKDYALILGNGDDAVSALTDFARRERVVAARFSGLGALREARFGWFDLKARAYRATSVAAQVEVLSMVGDIGVDPAGNPVVHGHLVMGDKEGRAFGGHLLAAVSSPTLELFLTTYPTPLTKRRDADTDLQFFNLPRTAADGNAL